MATILLMEEVEVNIFKNITNLKFNAKFAKGLINMLMNATIEIMKDFDKKEEEGKDVSFLVVDNQ